MPNKRIQEQEVINLLKMYYGIDITSAQLILGGADINAFAYKADAKSNSYFVKFKHGDHDEINLEIIRLLHAAGIKEIIFPILTLEKKLFQQLNNYKIIVYPFIHGANGFTQNLSEEQWKHLGKTVNKIHNISVPADIQKKLRKETYSSKWRDMVRTFYSKIEPVTSDDQITKDFKLFFKKNINAIHRLVDTADELTKKIKPEFEKYVLCHSDIHAGNVLITNNEIYIIDWDEPMLAPKERDLMFIGGGVGNIWNKPQEIQYFYEGYGAANIDETILSYYRHERIVEDIAVYTKDLLVREQSDQDRLEMFKHFKDMFEPNGVVDIALR